MCKYCEHQDKCSVTQHHLMRGPDNEYSSTTFQILDTGHLSVKFEAFWTEDSRDSPSRFKTSDQIKIEFCPFCGRKLTSEEG